MGLVFDSTINLGNILTLAATIGGGFWAYHKWDITTELRHQDNKNQINNIDSKVDRLDKKIDTNNTNLTDRIEENNRNVNQKADRLELKIDENTKTTNGVNSRVIDTNAKIEKHIVADDILQREILRRLDKVDK